MSAGLLAVVALVACASTEEGEDPYGFGSPGDTEETEEPESKERPAFDASFEPTPETPDSGSGGPSGGDGGGGPCNDKDDPGATENVAKVLPATTDCDDNYKTVAGIVQSAVDVDMFKLSGTDKTLCSVETDFDLKTSNVQLCVFLKCTNGTLNPVTGCAAGVSATSDTGMKGCCTSKAGHVTPEWDCGGITDNDSADFVIRVKGENANACLAYQFDYRF